MRRLAGWPRFRLRTRIALTLLLVVIAVEALNAVVFVLMPARLLTVYSAHWLIEQSEHAALAIFQADTNARGPLSAQLGADNRLKIRWLPSWDEARLASSTLNRPFLERARAAVEAELKGKVIKVAVKGLLELRGNQFKVDVLQQPPNFVSRLAQGPLKSGEPDLPIVGPFELAVQGLDGSWVVIGSEGSPIYAPGLQPLLIFLLSAAALVSLLSAFVARRWLRPLDRLAQAARKFGHTRKAVRIDPAGLQEFEVIEQAMNEMQDGIKRFLDERTHMLAAISHDLRSGLTGLRLDAEELPEGEAKERLAGGMEDMERMISATLAFAGDELKGEPVQLIDLAALLISLCDSFSDRNCAASYSGPDHLFARCQPVAIKRAFTNLIDNAIKYGGCARVTLSNSGGRAAVSIADNGPGIALDKAELAFQPFRRLDASRNRDTGGVGLGLTIARDIIQSHGGEIALGVPPQGSGLEVRVSVPLPPSRCS
jgi:signal transduction histidine kinase